MSDAAHPPAPREPALLLLHRADRTLAEVQHVIAAATRTLDELEQLLQMLRTGLPPAGSNTAACSSQGSVTEAA